MTKKHKSVADIAAELAQDPNARESVTKEINQSKLVSLLIKLRLRHNVSQKEIAKRMGCSPSKISRLESSNDLTLRWSEIVSYVGALGLQMNLSISNESLPAAQQIKQCVFRIHDLLENLAILAKKVSDDETITEKIHQFYGEVLFNFLTKFTDSYNKLSEVIEIPQEKTRIEIKDFIEEPSSA